MTTLHLLEAAASSVSSALHLQEIDWTAVPAASGGLALPGDEAAAPAVAATTPPPGTGSGTTGPGNGGFNFRDVPPDAPQEVRQLGEKVFGAMKFGGMAIAVICFSSAGIMIMAGKTRNHNLAAQGMSNVMWVIVGLGVLLSTVSIIGFFANG
ncbi:hypothetical protein GCM10010156_66480 [Planobispora rosea]|uniref:Uncharacterized protein n=1 Tax=Planobispora rosea TaxID=35762 RepID=A0A8J3S8L0_PLARO|nr:hypothetical protein [Planobispora rosea]GGS99046.1 hypothetical protein GCM10010156_66480 [Planobispora rosea]GIH88011.1 hypothetical protein Pro02_64190 [Planobispora rosea]